MDINLAPLFKAFTERVKSEFSGVAKVEIIVHDEGAYIEYPVAFILMGIIFLAWAAEKGMVSIQSNAHRRATSYAQYPVSSALSSQ